MVKHLMRAFVFGLALVAGCAEEESSNAPPKTVVRHQFVVDYLRSDGGVPHQETIEADDIVIEDTRISLWVWEDDGWSLIATFPKDQVSVRRLRGEN